MKTYIYKAFLVLLCISLLLSVAGCAKDKQTVGTDEEERTVESLSTGVDFTPAGNVGGLDLVAETDRLQMLLDQETATVSIVDKTNGYVWKSNLSEEEVQGVENDDVRNQYMSQLLISYYNSSNNKVIYDSYNYAVKGNDAMNPTVRYYGLENGLRVVYTIGQSIDYFYMPQVLSDEYFEELTGMMTPEDAEMFTMMYEPLVYDEVSDELIESYKLSYRNFAPGDTVYQLATSSQLMKIEYYNTYLKGLGIVDDEYIDEAYNAVGYSYKKPDIPQFNVAMDYTLTATGLNVNVPMDEVVFDEKSFRLNAIQVLPFFGATTDSKDADMIIPDGSGAIISTQLETNASIALPFYGTDHSLWTTETAENMQQATLPVYGINRGSNAFVTYVSYGEGIGSVECHPKNSVYPFAYIGSTFVTHPFETYASNGASSQATMQKYASERYEYDITLDYLFISGDSLSYVDMAKSVRNHLFQNKEKVTDDSLRFYLDTYGMVLRKENFLGYAYNKDTALTTFEQAQQMYDELNTNGITNIAVRYNNWYDDSYVNKISHIGKVNRVIGGKNGMTEFMEYVNGKGGIVYPSIELVMEKYSVSLADATWHSKFIEGTMIDYADTNLYSEGVTADVFRLVVKSDVIVDKIDGIMKKMNKLGTTGIALSTVGEQMFSDFTEDEVRFRNGVQADMCTVMDTVSQTNQIMVDKGNAYTLPYADDILGVSMGCSNLSFEKTEIPFVQMVLHGYVSYAGDSLNLSDDYEMQLLKSVEYGANLAYTLNYATAEMVKNTNYSELYSTNYAHWAEKAVADYKAVAEVLNGCQTSTIEDHKTLADGVYMTTYDNGVSVIVNYGEADYTYGNTVVKAKGFARVNSVAKEG